MSAASSLRRRMLKAAARKADRNEVGVPSTRAGRVALLEQLIRDKKLSSAEEARARQALGMPPE